jgi:glycolate oxidase iron-sulfur subunit
MSKLHDLATLLKDIQTDLARCARCGMCLSVCPLYLETGREADAARGKLALLDGLLEEILDAPQGASARLNRCLLCGACSAVCPNGVNAIEIFLKARTGIGEVIGLPFVKRQALKKLLAVPGRFDRASKFARKFQKWAIRPANQTIGTATFKVPFGSTNARHFLPLAPISFLESLPSPSTVENLHGPKIMFFIGCLIDKILPRIAQAALKVFHHHRITALIPESQGCCGIPALSSGDKYAMIHLIHHHLRLFDPLEFDFLVTACATCTYTIKKLWPMMTADDPEMRLKTGALSLKTVDINAFIASLGVCRDQTSTDGQTRETVTYHDPCHLKKSLGIYREPRELILANPEYSLIEMEGPDRCCGMGGSFTLSHYDLSARIGSRKRESILMTGCHTVASGCPACIMQLSDMLTKSHQPVLIKHPIEIYAEGLG